MDEEKIRKSFVFYGTTYDAMVELEQKSADDAYKFVKAVAQYGLYGDYDKSDPMINALMQQAIFGIEQAASRRQNNMDNGKKGGRKKQFCDEDIWLLKDQGLTNKQVAEKLGCSDRTVERANGRRTDKTDKTLI